MEGNLDPFLQVDRVKEILQSAHPLRVGVFGDFSLAGDWTVDGSGPVHTGERPASSFSIIREQYSCGDGAEVACALAAFGVSEVLAFTVLGEDWRADMLRRMLGTAGIDARDAVTAPGWSTPFSGRLTLAAGERSREDGQINFVNTAELPLDVEEDLLTRLENNLPDLDALVVTDAQTAGVITPGLLEGLNRLVGQGEEAVITVRSRARIGQFEGMVRVPNRIEAARWLFPDRSVEVGLNAFVEAALYPQVDCGCPLFIYLGEQGSLVLAGGESHLAPPAGDLKSPVSEEVFLAALTAALAAGAHPLEAAGFGNLAAAAFARKKEFSGVAVPEGILALASAWKQAD